MTAAFTKHYALEQDREELRRAADTEQLANIDKAKHHIVIYACPKVHFGVRGARGFFLLIMFQQDKIEATVVEVQGGFHPLRSLASRALKSERNNFLLQTLQYIHTHLVKGSAWPRHHTQSW